MQKTKIEWCDYTWNPVTGCLHGCEYCYARQIARRFCFGPWNTIEDGITHFVGEPWRNKFYKDNRADPYPYGFDPTFFLYRLEEPQHVKKPSKIFVSSMGDLFGEWVPDEWIREVFAACEKAPQHTYLFLTKNYSKAAKYRYKENWWIGKTITCDIDPRMHECYIKGESGLSRANQFLSIEPLLGNQYEELPYFLYGYKWVIIGAMTGSGSKSHQPKREWVADIVDQCRAANVPVFMKNSLAGVWGEDLMQDWPEGMK